MQTLKCTHNICLNFGETNHHKFSSLTKHQFSTFQFCRKSKQAPMFSYLSQCMQQVAVSPDRWVLGEKPCSYLFQPPDAAGLLRFTAAGPAELHHGASWGRHFRRLPLPPLKEPGCIAPTCSARFRSPKPAAPANPSTTRIHAATDNRFSRRGYGV